MKNKLFSTLTKITLATGTALLLTACGGGSSSSSTGTLNLAITDAPVDNATSVVVVFTGVELQGPDGRVSKDFVDEDGIPVLRQIDLLALTGGATDVLLDDVTLAAGNYSWMRLKVNAEKDVEDSYIDFENGDRFSLYVPSGSQSGLKLNRGFVVPAGGESSFVIDFDLRKSVHKPSGNFDDYILRPTLRLEDQTSTGKLKGTISTALIDSACTPAVYVFNAEGTVDDIDGTDDPITTTNAKFDEEGNADYTVAFLSEGDYKIAYTCDSANDDPEIDNPGTNEPATATTDTATETTTETAPVVLDTVSFSGETTVTISQGETTIFDFSADPDPDPIPETETVAE